MLEPDDVKRVNEAFSAISLSETRAQELPVELQQFRYVIERVRHRLVFEEEPAAFLKALSDCAQAD